MDTSNGFPLLVCVALGLWLIAASHESPLTIAVVVVLLSVLAVVLSSRYWWT